MLLSEKLKLYRQKNSPPICTGGLNIQRKHRLINATNAINNERKKRHAAYDAHQGIVRSGCNALKAISRGKRSRHVT